MHIGSKRFAHLLRKAIANHARVEILVGLLIATKRSAICYSYCALGHWTGEEGCEEIRREGSEVFVAGNGE
jgi:hypothetical protein